MHPYIHTLQGNGVRRTVHSSRLGLTIGQLLMTITVMPKCGVELAMDRWFDPLIKPATITGEKSLSHFGTGMESM